MSTEAQRVVVIQDASRNDVSAGAIGWVLQGLSLKPGDVLTLLGILHQVNPPMVYRVSVDSSSRKIEEYQHNEEITKIAKQCEREQIKFHIEVRTGPSGNIAIKAATCLRATWVILDRQMKKNKKYFMDNLSCGLSWIKRDNTIEKLREPIPRENAKLAIETSKPRDSVIYDEMIQGSPKEKVSPQSLGKEQDVDDCDETAPLLHRKSSSLCKSSSSEQLTTTSVLTSSLSHTEASSSSFTDVKRSSILHFQEEDITTNTELETVEEQSPFSFVESPERGQKEVCNTGSPQDQLMQHNHNFDWMGGIPVDEEFKNAVCPICKNRRPKIGWKRDFTCAELQAATEGFSLKNFLSEGGFGFVYRGELNGLKIAVKQHKNASLQGEKEFKSEVQFLSKARHENLVMLLGSCSDGNSRLLVYEYICNGSLDQHLSKHARRPLSWEKRMKIAMGAAKGLLYLHYNNIIHGDMRPNNILVTHDYESMLGDFGLARTQQEDSDHSSETRLVETLAPEYAECGKVSKKTDVYSFGVVLLQLITGLKTTDKRLGGKSLVGWARPLLKERNYPDLIDHRILDSHDVHQLFWMVRIAEKCLSKHPQKRLTMDHVVCALNYLMEASANCSITDLSPLQSDSVKSIRGSSESQGDDADAPSSIDSRILSEEGWLLCRP
ncbi:probable receptor-like protein kinase At3g17420 [Tripterygium wilfordii]|uniref:probable receptor-like protein kinase At3g17420 n=1 Tax=Tripterygium wilfordii TaxID=458696 RepID=UPI0018F83EA4|nr:probable receptor-like protein kinase At3g17420 [Tripterygium wilfordii]